jgi:hypothetical protein
MKMENGTDQSIHAPLAERERADRKLELAKDYLTAILDRNLKLEEEDIAAYNSALYYFRTAK